MQDNATNSKVKILEQVVSSYEAEYKDITVLWQNLETKAQATLAISGVLISVSGLTVSKLAFDFPTVLKLTLSIATTFLACSVASSILALFMKTDMPFPRGEAFKKLTNPILNCPDDELTERNIRLFNYRFKIWEDILNERKSAYDEKANHLATSQHLLLISLVLMALTIVIMILSGG